MFEKEVQHKNNLLKTTNRKKKVKAIPLPGHEGLRRIWMQGSHTYSAMA